MTDQKKTFAALANGQMSSLGSEAVRTVAFQMKDALESLADNGVVDSGMGFGEFCYDLWLDDKAIRVIVKEVPELHRGHAKPVGNV